MGIFDIFRKKSTFTNTRSSTSSSNLQGVSNAPDIRYSKSGKIQSVYDPQSGLTFLVADQLDEITAPAVLAHDILQNTNTKNEFKEKSAPFFILSEAMRQGQKAGHTMPDEKFWLWLKKEIGGEVCDMTKNTMSHINKNFLHGQAADEMSKLTLAEWDYFANGLIKVIRDENP